MLPVLLVDEEALDMIKMKYVLGSSLSTNLEKLMTRKLICGAH
jgi:hypothetical protein